MALMGVFTMRRICVTIVTGFSVLRYLATAEEVVMKGDVTIAGMFEVKLSSNGECGTINPASVMAMEAMRWYLTQLNANNVLPFTLGFRGYATCGNTGLAGKYATEILQQYRESKSGNSNATFIVGVVGPQYSSEAESLSNVFKSQIEADRMLIISPSATASNLNDRAMHPTFYRAIPDDTVQIQAMAELMKALDWNRVGVIYVNDTYGRNGAETLVVHARKNKICIPEEYPIKINSARAVSTGDLENILNRISFASPKITGVVYFGDIHVANKLFLALQNLGLTDIPIFLLSESVELQESVFQSPDGSTLSTSKGSMVMSAPVTEITSFMSYWQQMMGSNTLLADASTINPFLSQIQANIETQPVYIKYSLIATHAMVKAIQQAYNHVCNNNPCQSVEEFKMNFHPSNLLDEMKKLTVSFKYDFNVTLDPLSRDNFTMTFDEMTNAKVPDSEPLYEVYNFKNNGTNVKQNFQLIKVGRLVHDGLELHTDEIKDYTYDGTETSFPEVRKGQCPVENKCEDCLPVDFSEIHLHVPGDFYVIGLISNNNRAIPGPQGCGTVRKRHGYQMFLCLQFAVEQIATSANFSEVRDNFGNRTIGLIVLNDCDNALEIARKVLKLHYNGLVLDSGETIELQNRILGYVGAQSTDVSQPAAEQLTKLGIVQISYSSTNPVLSDRTRYPYFMRIVTPDNVQAQAMIEIVKGLGGKYIQLVHSEGAYGEGGRDSVIAAAKEHGVCIAQVTTVIESDNYFGYINILRRRPHAKLVIVFLRSHVVTPFMDHLRLDMTRGEYQFIGSEAWGRNSEILEYEINQGSLTLALEMKKNEDLNTFIKEQIPEKEDVNSRLEEYITSRQDCYFPFSFDKTFAKQCTPADLPVSEADFESDPWCIFATNTMFSFLEGSAKFFQQKCGAVDKLCSDYVDNPDGLVEVMKEVEMDIDGSGKIKLYDSVGDGNMGYKILNIQSLEQDRSKRQYVEVGSFSVESGFTLDKAKVRYPTDNVVISSCPNEQACINCTETIAPTTSSTTTEPPETKLKETPLVYVFAGLFAVCLFVAIALGCLLYRKGTKTNKDPYHPYFIPTSDNYLTPMGDRPNAVGNDYPDPPEQCDLPNDLNGPSSTINDYNEM